jgi:hypothetical protein
MQNENVKFKIQKEKVFYGLENITKVDQKIYQKRKSEDSQRNFGFEKTRRRNQKTLSKIFKTI